MRYAKKRAEALTPVLIHASDMNKTNNTMMLDRYNARLRQTLSELFQGYSCGKTHPTAESA